MNDEIVKINDIKISSVKALRSIISAAGVQELKILVTRGQGGHVFAITPEPIQDSSPAKMEPGAP